MVEGRLQEHTGGDSVFFLPGEAPEAWVWEALKQFSADEAKELGLAKDERTTKLRNL